MHGVMTGIDFPGFDRERDVLGRCLLFFNGPEGRFPLAIPPPP